MTAARSIVVVATLSVGAAALVAVVSRAPASVRTATAGPAETSATLGARFSEDQIARHGAFRGPLYLALAAGTMLQVLLLVVLARGPMGALVTRLSSIPGGWPVHAALAGMSVAILGALVALPLSYVTGHVLQHAWGLSTQGWTGWLLDQARGLAVAAAIAAIAATAFFGIVRWQPRTWWLWGWGAFTGLTVVLVFLYPVVIAPLFNRFTPLADRALVVRIEELAARAGVDVDAVLVADASRRTSTENAYVAGLGSTKRVVLYDTLLAAGDEPETLFVVAHELAHEAEDHVAKNVLISSAGLLVGFFLLARLAAHEGLWGWGGANGVGDIRALPLLLLFVALLTLVSAPLQASISRSFEATADRIALDLTEDPDTAVHAFRRLAFANVADLRPPRVAVALLFSHPPITDRIAAAVAANALPP